MRRVRCPFQDVLFCLHIVSSGGINFGRGAERKRLREDNASSGVALVAVVGQRAQSQVAPRFAAAIASAALEYR
jgi:hypothetical protein